MAASVVPLACTMEFQKVMLTVPLWLASALRLQLGRLAAPAGAAGPAADDGRRGGPGGRGDDEGRRHETGEA